MRYNNPQLIDRLAAAYVLGTLTGAARRRFERLAREAGELGVQQAIWRWERHLNPMAENLAAVQPREQVWLDIRARLESGSKPAAGLWFWRSLAAAMTIAVVALLLPYLAPVPVPTPAQMALIQDSEQQPLWVISVDLDEGTIRSRAINIPARDMELVFELWMLPTVGQPQSFGLLPVTGGARVKHQISPALLALLQGSQGLAVSLEPPGGSPTGLPTGPVVYTAPIVEL